MQSSKYTLDRFEGDLAVLLLREDESIEVDIPKARLSGMLNKGDIIDIRFHPDGTIEKAILLKEETEKAKMEVNKVLREILQKNS
jgi:hypothetical protein